MNGTAAIVATVVVLGAAVYDAWTGRIPNWLNGIGIAIAMLVAATAGTVPEALLGLLLAVLIGGALFFVGGMGGGDAKLLAFVGAALGSVHLLEAAGWAFALAAAWSVIRLYRTGLLLETGRQLFMLGCTLMTPRARIHFQPPVVEVRFGPAIAAGVLLVAWWPVARFIST